MRRFIAVILTSLLVFASTPRTFAAAKSTGTITGVARSTAGQPLHGHSVRVRSVRTGDVVATATTSADGSFVVPNLDPGSYVVEIVDTAGRIVGTSAIATVVEGSIASLMVTAASTELVGGVSTALVVVLVAAAAVATTAIIVANTGDEQPGQLVQAAFTSAA